MTHLLEQPSSEQLQKNQLRAAFNEIVKLDPGNSFSINKARLNELESISKELSSLFVIESLAPNFLSSLDYLSRSVDNSVFYQYIYVFLKVCFKQKEQEIKDILIDNPIYDTINNLYINLVEAISPHPNNEILIAVTPTLRSLNPLDRTIDDLFNYYKTVTERKNKLRN